MLHLQCGNGHNKVHAASIISYLKRVFPVQRRFNGRYRTQLKLAMAIVDVKTNCGDGVIHVTVTGYSKNDDDRHGEVAAQRVRREIQVYLRSSHAAKWRDKVTGI